MTLPVLDARSGPIAILQTGENTAEAQRQALIAQAAASVLLGGGSTIASLAALAGVTPAANKVPMFTGPASAGSLIFDPDPTMAANSATRFIPQSLVRMLFNAAIGIPGATVFIGDSITQGSSDQLNNIHGNSWALHSALTLGDRLRLIRNAGVGGNTTAQMATRFAADVLAYLPAGGLVGILGGTNDTDGVSDSLANIEAMIVAARGAGCNVFLATPPPQGVAALATPAAPTLAAATTGGTLASATYSYKIAALNAVGTTLASANATVPVTGPTGSVKITWPQVQGASQYKIYGRTAGSELLIATITPSSTGLVFVDTGSVTPAGALPASNTTAIARDATKHLKLGRVRLSIQKLARKYGLVVLDFYTLLTDPASGLYQTGYTEDGVHPTAKVHRLMGVYAQTVLGPLLKTGNNVIWPADNANPAGLTGNALLQNTASGRPTGWVSFGGAVTETMTTDAAIAGAAFQVAATDYSLHVIESPTYAVNAGDTIAFMGKVSISGADAGFSAVALGARWSGGTYLSRMSINADTNGVVPFYFEGVAPAGTTNVKLELTTNLGPVTVKIGQVEFLNLTALGLA